MTSKAVIEWSWLSTCAINKMFTQDALEWYSLVCV